MIYLNEIDLLDSNIRNWKFHGEIGSALNGRAYSDYKLVTKLIQYIHMPLLLSKGAYTHVDKCTNRVLRT